MTSHLKKNLIFINIIAFLTAFCSLAYEIILGTKLSHMLGEGIWVYPLYLSIFIFFMGLGAVKWYGVEEKVDNVDWQRLLRIEIFLTVVGFFSIVLIDLVNVFIPGIVVSLMVGVIFSGMIGYWTGQELPLVFRFCSYLSFSQKNIRRIIFFDYLASFFSSLTLALFFFPMVGLLKTSIIISFLNLVVGFLILKVCSINAFVFKRSYSLIAVMLLFVYFFVGLRFDAFENKIIQWIYCEPNIVLLDKINTPYHQILLFLTKTHSSPILDPDAEIEADPQQYFIDVTMNGSLQFSNRIGTQQDAYHYFMIDPFVRLLPNVKKVLILGGGDGLPAREAVRHKQIESITMVDIDKKWVEFTRDNKYMKLITQKSLEDPRLNLFFDDAFKWVIKSKEKFDLIVIDFPAELASLASIRVGSIQFLRDLSRILNENGVIVSQDPELFPRWGFEILSKTATEAQLFMLSGIKLRINYLGDNLSQYVYFKNEKDRQSYRYKYEKERDEGRGNKNFRFGFIRYFDVEDSPYVLSVYDPFVSEVPLFQKIQYWRDLF